MILTCCRLTMDIAPGRYTVASMTRNTKSFRLSPLLQLSGGMAIFAILAIDDGLRIWRAYSESAVGPIAVGALAFLLTVGLGAAIVLRFEKMPLPARRAAVCLIPAWFLLMMCAVIATHTPRGVDMFYEAAGELNSLWSIAAVTYQTCVWVIAFAALPTGAWMWWRVRQDRA